MLVQVMDKTLSKLATFDEGSMMGSMLGFVVSIVMIPLQKKLMSLTCHLSEQEDQCARLWHRSRQKLHHVHPKQP